MGRKEAVSSLQVVVSVAAIEIGGGVKLVSVVAVAMQVVSVVVIIIMIPGGNSWRQFLAA